MHRAVYEVFVRRSEWAAHPSAGGRTALGGRIPPVKPREYPGEVQGLAPQTPPGALRTIEWSRESRPAHRRPRIRDGQPNGGTPDEERHHSTRYRERDRARPSGFRLYRCVADRSQRRQGHHLQRPQRSGRRSDQAVERAPPSRHGGSGKGPPGNAPGGPCCDPRPLSCGTRANAATTPSLVFPFLRDQDDGRYPSTVPLSATAGAGLEASALPEAISGADPGRRAARVSCGSTPCTAATATARRGPT